MVDYTQRPGEIHFILMDDEYGAFMRGEEVVKTRKNPAGIHPERIAIRNGDKVLVGSQRIMGFSKGGEEPTPARVVAYKREQRGKGQKRPQYNYFYTIKKDQ